MEENKRLSVASAAEQTKSEGLREELRELKVLQDEVRLENTQLTAEVHDVKDHCYRELTESRKTEDVLRWGQRSCRSRP